MQGYSKQTGDDFKGINSSENAFKKIFESYFDSLLYFANEYVKNIEISRNIVQDSFMTLWEVRNDLNPDSNIRAFLYKVTRNGCLNFLEKEKVRQKYIHHIEADYKELLLNYLALNDLETDSVEFDQLNKIINETIESLPEKCKLVFKKSRFSGLKNREIADEMGISLKTVEGHISVAIKTLKTALKERYSADVVTMILAAISL